MKLELHQGTDSHNFPTHLAGANGRTDEIAYRDEFPSLSYSANLSAVDADALLNTRLTVLGFPRLIISSISILLCAWIAPLRTFFSELFMMLVRKHWNYCPLLLTKFFPSNRVLAYENC